MKLVRSSGVQLHPTSLPKGRLGAEAYAFVDWLADAGQSWWQMLPLVILLSAATGAMTGVALVLLRRRERGKPMPFGPFLAVAGWIAMMWGPEFVDYYLRYTGFA